MVEAQRRLEAFLAAAAAVVAEIRPAKAAQRPVAAALPEAAAEGAAEAEAREAEVLRVLTLTPALRRQIAPTRTNENAACCGEKIRVKIAASVFAIHARPLAGRFVFGFVDFVAGVFARLTYEANPRTGCACFGRLRCEATMRRLVPIK